MLMRILILSMMLLTNTILAAQSFTVATFNIRYANPKDSGNLWVDRKQRVTDLIRFHGFDIVGVQEALRMQLDDMAQLMPEFTWYGIGRDDGKSRSEEHTSELQSHHDLVCRLLLEKKS